MVLSQAQQVTRKRPLLVRLEDTKLGHQIAGFDVLAASDESHQVFSVERQRLGANRTAAADMRQIRADGAGRLRAAHRVTGAATGGVEDRLAAQVGVGCCLRRRGFMRQPCLISRPAAWRRLRKPSLHADRRNTLRIGRDKSRGVRLPGAAEWCGPASYPSCRPDLAPRSYG